MGEVSETMTKRKKKGRPSLLDLQKRSLKKEQQKQQQQQNPNSHSNNVVPHDDDDDERKEKKHKLLVGLNSHLRHPTLLPNSQPFNSDPEAAVKRRKIDPLHQTDGKVPKATDSKHGSQGESGPTTPLPDKKLLLFILDRLQKKDTHGVFAEPVDPEELPDYHDSIKHPMDFGTVRKKLDGGLYTDLEQFEKDVFLICSNAMQYNSPDTIYHRQARAMQEIARKDFENLRQDSDDSEPQPKIVHRGRPPGKHTRKSLGMPPSERVGPESSSDATLASGGDIASGSNGYNLRKGPSKFQPTDSYARAYNNTFNGGGHTGWSEWENEFPASVVKAVLRYGKKQFVVDETRRDTYKNPTTLGNERPVLTTVEDEFKQLLAVGLQVKHSYARSLAHFAADLGPVVWKIAASKISSVLPTGHEFGPGRVSEDDVSQRQHFPVCDEGRTSDPPVPEDYRRRFSSPSGSFPLAKRSCLQSGDMVINNYQNELNSVISIGGGSEFVTPVRIQHESVVHSDDFGSHDRLGSSFSPQMKMVRLADLTGSPSAGVVPQMFDKDPISSRIAHTNINPSLKGQYLSKSSQLDSGNLCARESGFEPRSWSQGLAGKSSWQGLEVLTKQNSFALANDLNGKIGTTNSPSSNVEAGSQLQPNLALQL
ncbi:Bromodomain and PHD finger-containing protein 3 [Spatholobus suberectus]|nr:Bromodomain and PHD finger-containing protein 3 [Spatholobus suberectus]